MPTLNLHSENELVHRLHDGDEKAFMQLYHLYKEKIYYNLLKVVKLEHVAEELLQDVFTKIWESHATLDTDKSFSAYMYRMAGNTAIDFYRKAARDRKLKEAMTHIGTELYEHVEQRIYRKENSELLNRAITKLPAKRQEIFRLCKLEGKSYEEVAQLMGVGVGTINDHIVKATRFLRKELKGESAFMLLVLSAVASN